MLAAAVLFDAEPLYVPGVALLALGVLALGWVMLGSAGAGVVREITAKRVVEDEQVDIRVSVRAGALALPGTCLDDPLLSEPLPLRAGRRSVRVRIEARFARRGWRELAPPGLRVRDPLGLAEANVAGSGEPDVLLVLPRVEPVLSTSSAGASAAAGGRRSNTLAAETEIDGVRPHRPGAPASRIYWPSVARGGALLERRLHAESDSRPMIVLDASHSPDEHDLDAAVRAVASLAVHLARTGGCAVLLPGDRRPTTLDPSMRGWSQLHSRLAVLEGGQRATGGALSTRRGAVIWVSGSRTSRPPRPLQLAGASARVLVVPGELPARRASFKVAGCTGYMLSAREMGEAA